MTAEQDRRFAAAIPVALELVGAVRDLGPEDVAEIMARADMPALAVALAAMVDDTRSPRELLSWSLFAPRATPTCEPELWGKSAGSGSVHGTRARYVAGCRGEACKAAESHYQHERHLRRKQEVAA